MVTESLPLFDLHGRVALITGAAGYLGSEMAAGLARAGAHVFLNGRREELLLELQERIMTSGGKATVSPWDVTNRSAITAGIDSIENSEGRLDIILNNAYGGPTGQAGGTDAIAYQHAYAVSVVASAEIVTVGIPLLRKTAQKSRGGASVINISSMYGQVSPDLRVYDDAPEFTNPPFYGAAKAGLIQLSRYLACKHAPERIRFNVIAPGPFPSDSVRAASPAFAEKLIARVPLGRLGNPEDLVAPVVFLAGDGAAYVTGTVLEVNGGWTAW